MARRIIVLLDRARHSKGVDMNRRTFFKTGIGFGASIAGANPTELISPGSSTTLFRGRRGETAPSVFPQSVASGDPQPNGIALWTRLSPDATSGGGAVIIWQISLTHGFEANSIVLQGVQSVSEAADFTAKVVLSHPALQPWTTYYYRFGFNGVFSNTGKFKTLPAAGMNLPLLRLGYISCQDYSNGYFTALDALAAEPVDFVVHLGDYIYETIASTGVVRPVPIFPSGGLVAATLDDYRHVYRTYRSDTSLQRVHENFAFIQIWDDHEFAEDSYQDYHPDNNPNPSEPTPELRQAANQAWSEYSASGIPFDPLQDSLNSIRIYRSFQFGRLADLVMTDERLYRNAPPCGLEQSQRFLTAGCPEMNNPARTMLGAGQRTWFTDRIQSSTARWKIWGNESMNMALKLVNGSSDTYVTLDQWDGFPAERSSVLTGLSNVKNLVAITGDIHSFAAGYLKPSYDSRTEPRLGVEFVGGSITSANFAEILAGARNTQTSAPVPPKLLRQAFPGGLVSLVALLMNPELEFFNSSTHGYNLLEITPDSMTCTMKSVSTVTEPAATVSTLASFVVPNGQRRIIRV